jgi:hypothetical protein
VESESVITATAGVELRTASPTNAEILRSRDFPLLCRGTERKHPTAKVTFKVD